jgi:hypothetical protein
LISVQRTAEEQIVERDYILRVFRETGEELSTAAIRLGGAPDNLECHDEEEAGISRKGL